VRLSLGRSDGVSKGMRFDVYRRDSPTSVVAVVKVTSVTERESRARPIEQPSESLADCWIRLRRTAGDKPMPISITNEGDKRVTGQIPHGPRERK